MRFKMVRIQTQYLKPLVLAIGTAAVVACSSGPTVNGSDKIVSAAGGESGTAVAGAAGHEPEVPGDATPEVGTGPTAPAAVPGDASTISDGAFGGTPAAPTGTGAGGVVGSLTGPEMARSNGAGPGASSGGAAAGVGVTPAATNGTTGAVSCTAVGAGVKHVNSTRTRIDPKESWWMTSDATAVPGGSVTVTTTTEDLDALAGFTGGVKVLFFNACDQLIGTTALRQYGVDGTGIFWGTNKRIDSFSEPCPADTSRIGIILSHAGKNRLEEDVAKAAEVAVTIYDLVDWLLAQFAQQQESAGLYATFSN